MEATLTDVARMAPSCCTGCLAAVGPFVDTGINLGAHLDDDFGGYGYLYFCEKCVAVLARAFGFETPEQVAERDAREAKLVETAEVLQGALDEARRFRMVDMNELVKLRDGLLETAATAADDS